MVELHFVHSLVLAFNQLAVSESSAHFFSHFFTTLQSTGRCVSAYPHPKHMRRLHLHSTMGTIWFSIRAGACEHSIMYSQFRCGHHRRFEASDTNDVLSRVWYLGSVCLRYGLEDTHFFETSGLTNRSTISPLMILSHPLSIHCILLLSPSFDTFPARYSVQQSPQNRCPQPIAMVIFSNSSCG